MSKIAYKAFDADMSCLGFEYEVGKSYTHEGPVKTGDTGFHACTNPADVLSYYSPAISRFAVVHQDGEISAPAGSNDSKRASEKITIVQELSLNDLVAHCVRSASGDAATDNVVVQYGPGIAQGPSSRSGVAVAKDYCSIAATHAGSSIAHCSSANSVAATSTGCGVAMTLGDSSISACTSYSSLAIAEGELSIAATTLVNSTAYASNPLSIAVSAMGWVKGVDGAVLFLVYYDHTSNRYTRAKAVIVGVDGIKPDVPYRLNEDGEVWECGVGVGCEVY